MEYRKFKIAVVVVTFNRLPLLIELIQSLRNQTQKPDEIFVVNNSCTDGTFEWLNDQNDITVITQENLGSSGGQYTGINAAYEKGYDWIWVMDDDVEPLTNCLEYLVKAISLLRHSDNVIIAPMRVNTKSEPHLYEAINYNLTNPFKSFWDGIVSSSDLNNELIPVVGVTFEGPMFHRSLIDKIGLPIKNFFIFGDDTEFFIRANKAGFRAYITKEAKLKRKIEYNEIEEEKFSWKHYYIIRNIIAIQGLHGNLAVRLIRPFGFLIRWLRRCKKWKDVKTVFKAFVNGYFYKNEP